MCTELGLNMCTRTGIKHVYLGVQGACPQQAVTGTGGMARACEGRAVGAGLKLVLRRIKKSHVIYTRVMFPIIFSLVYHFFVFFI